MSDSDGDLVLEPSLEEKLASDLTRQGWCVVPDFIARSLALALREEVDVLRATGRFRPAGIGREGDYSVRPEVRGDAICWLENDQDSPTQSLLKRLEALRQSVNRHLYLGLQDIEAHFAVYPPGSFYKKHIDTFRGRSSRVLSTVVYLNDGWEQRHGGELMLFDRDSESQSGAVISPTLGTMVCFLSSEIWHEVCVARRERYSVAGWYVR